MNFLETKLKETYETLNPEHIIHGHEWYDNAYKLIKIYSDDLRVKPEEFATVTSILSPFNPWERNIVDASKLIFAVKYEPEQLEKLTFTTFKNNVRKAIGYIKGEVMLEYSGANKTYSFAKNLLLNPDYVTIDSHLLKLVDMQETFGVKTLTERAYNEYSETVKKVSKGYFLHGYQFQASLWLHARENL